jgi:hypothetical protein
MNTIGGSNGSGRQPVDHHGAVISRRLPSPLYGTAYGLYCEGRVRRRAISTPRDLVRVRRNQEADQAGHHGLTLGQARSPNVHLAFG